MSFLDCIKTAVDTGRLSQKKADEATAAYDGKVQENIASGVSESSAHVGTADAALKEITTLKQDKRWQRINEMQKAHTLYERINKSNKPWDELDIVMDQVNLGYDAVRGQLMSTLNELIYKYMPKIGGVAKSVDNMDDIVRALYGEATNSEAAGFAKAVAEVEEFGRQRLNLEGASIKVNKNRKFGQTQDRMKAQSVTKEEWIRDQLEHWDFEVMEYQGKPIPADKREEIIGLTYDRIITDGDINLSPAAPSQLPLAGRLSRERFIYYKNADSWLAMQKKYGTGDFFHQLIERIDSVARDVSIMEAFGPNPNVMKSFAERSMHRRAAEITVADPSKNKGMKNKLTKAENRFRSQWDIQTRSVDTGAEDFWAKAAATVRSLTGTALLGSVAISSLNDIAVGRWARQFYKMPQTGLIRRYVKAMGRGRNSARQMMSDGVVYESGLAQVQNNVRYMMGHEGPNWPKIIGDINFRSTGMHLLTSAGKGVAAGDLSRAFATVRNSKFDDIPFVHVMRTVGITEADWNLVKGTALYEPEYHNFGKGEFLRPIDMWTGATTDEAKRAADKFLKFQAMFVRDAVPTGILRARAFLGEDLPATKFSSQIIKSMSQLGLFTATIHFNHLRKIFNAPSVRDKAVLGASFFIHTTVAGGIITQIKDVLSGKEINPMTNWEFWIRSVMNGGAGAIIGDMIYNQLSGTIYGSSTPLGDQWTRFKKLAGEGYKKIVDGDKNAKFGKAAIDFGWGLLPKPYPVKLLMERLVTDELLKEADPGAYQRKIQAQRKHEQETGQGYWWGTGQSAEPAKIFGG